MIEREYGCGEGEIAQRPVGGKPPGMAIMGTATYRGDSKARELSQSRG